VFTVAPGPSVPGVITGIGALHQHPWCWYPSAIRGADRTQNQLRIFLQDGSHDFDNVHGFRGPIANQDMIAALTFAGYDLKSVIGSGGHSGNTWALLFDALVLALASRSKRRRPRPRCSVKVPIPPSKACLSTARNGRKHR
jgi:hypothetical protein